MKKLLLILFLLSFSNNAIATEFPWEKQTGHMSTGMYGWDYSYDIGFYSDTLMVDVDINLVGDDPGDTLRSRWEIGIENIWSTNRFSVPISFNVDWVTTDYDYLVTVSDTTGRWNMVQWYTIGAGGWGDAYQEEVAAHEAGHMLAQWDEYSGGAVDPVTGLIDTGGLMHTLDGPTLDYYYDDFYSWLDEKMDTTPVPEPATMLLLASGLVGLTGLRKRFKK